MSGSLENVKIKKKSTPTSTVGRGKSVKLSSEPAFTELVSKDYQLFLGDSLMHYEKWASPTVIVSDGAYGVLGFEGDTSDHMEIADWYEPHIQQWSKFANPNTTLWFWNSEIGWATVHPILEKYGWRYVNCNIWDKGKGHIAGNVNTAKIRRFPVVTEVCVQYVRDITVDDNPLKVWLKSEWKRTGMPFRLANEACGVKDVATRKYFDQGHLWYFPPPPMFKKLADYANKNGKPEGRPYYSIDGKKPVTEKAWAAMRSKFNCPHGYTNVWQRNALRNSERIKNEQGKAVHLNQKPLDLMRLNIVSASDAGDVVWEPFGGLFSASLAAVQTGRQAYSAEIDWTYFSYGTNRFSETETCH